MVESLVSKDKIIIDISDIRHYIKIIKYHSKGLDRYKYKVIKANLKHSKELLTEIENTWEFVKTVPNADEEVKIDRMNRMAIEIKYLLDYLDKTLGLVHTLMDIYKEYDQGFRFIQDNRKVERFNYSQKYLAESYYGK